MVLLFQAITVLLLCMDGVATGLSSQSDAQALYTTDLELTPPVVAPVYQ